MTAEFRVETWVSCPDCCATECQSIAGTFLRSDDPNTVPVVAFIDAFSRARRRMLDGCKCNRTRSEAPTD